MALGTRACFLTSLCESTEIREHIHNSSYILNEKGEGDHVDEERKMVPMNLVKSVKSVRWKTHVAGKQFREISTTVPQIMASTGPRHQHPAGQFLQSCQRQLITCTCPSLRLSLQREAYRPRIIFRSMSVYGLGVKIPWISEVVLVVSGAPTKMTEPILSKDVHAIIFVHTFPLGFASSLALISKRLNKCFVIGLNWAAKK